jgi:purine-binding chemotaxis protein CheW
LLIIISPHFCNAAGSVNKITSENQPGFFTRKILRRWKREHERPVHSESPVKNGLVEPAVSLLAPISGLKRRMMTHTRTACTAHLLWRTLEKMDTIEKKTSNTMQLVSFMIDKELFAIDVMRVQGVERPLQITSVPGMPDFLEGVINIRDTILPVIDLRKRFALPAKEYNKDTRIILIELQRNVLVGMIVDSVKEVFQLDSDQVGGVPRIGKPKMDTRFIKGVGKKDGGLIIILEVERIFSEDEAKGIAELR